MNTTKNLHFFSYKGAFVFFAFILAFNLIFNPVILLIGMSKDLAVFITNSIGLSVGLTSVIVFIEGKFKNKKQASILFFSLFVFCTVTCYIVVFNS
ncbi:hypothetical protein [Bacillus sp. AFS041924]|uniref:hypothetical protein n=1 Tax=Bacillus sp. AFS041924 TaxID=2033503 RepID=UPI000BFDA7B3|nr:hypothetical protein [Bacillus sp. AFS041924]PGS49843.1 hypothetical protein COC46_14365 [Bacillus sp. AFS041924]